MKILVSDNLSPKGIDILRREPDMTVDVKTGLTEDQLVECIGEYDALLIRSATKVTARVLEAAGKLRVVGRAGVGVDNVDRAAASRQGVVVMNTPGGNTITTAEHTLSLLTCLARNIPQADNSVREGRWERKKYQGVELAGKTLGIIGLGRIGKEIAARARAMGLKIVAFDPFVTADEAKKLGVGLCSPEGIYPQADFITIHTPLTKETRHLINKETIAKMKPGVRIINCARGGIIDESALVEAVRSGRVAGAALDVYEQEPPAADSPLLGLEGIICTPHLGASTTEAQEKVALDVAAQVIAFLRDGLIVNAVNVPKISAEAQSRLDPYLKLGYNLGSLLGQLIGTTEGVEKIQAGLAGEQLWEYNHVVANQVTAGVMKGLCPGEKVNIINAQALAETRGITVVHPLRLSHQDYTSLIQLQIETNKGQRSAAAALLSKKLPRVIMLDGFKLEFDPSGYVLILFNNDRPGIIGGIGTALGERGINIAGMQFGRKALGGDAISIFRVDSEVPADLLPVFEGLPQIKSAQQILL